MGLVGVVVVVVVRCIVSIGAIVVRVRIEIHIGRTSAAAANHGPVHQVRVLVVMKVVRLLVVMATTTTTTTEDIIKGIGIRRRGIRPPTDGADVHTAQVGRKTGHSLMRRWLLLAVTSTSSTSSSSNSSILVKEVLMVLLLLLLLLQLVLVKLMLQLHQLLLLLLQLLLLLLQVGGAGAEVRHARADCGLVGVGIGDIGVTATSGPFLIAATTITSVTATTTKVEKSPRNDSCPGEHVSQQVIQIVHQQRVGVGGQCRWTRWAPYALADARGASEALQGQTWSPDVRSVLRHHWRIVVVVGAHSLPTKSHSAQSERSDVVLAMLLNDAQLKVLHHQVVHHQVVVVAAAVEGTAVVVPTTTKSTKSPSSSPKVTISPSSSSSCSTAATGATSGPSEQHRVNVQSGQLVGTAVGVGAALGVKAGRSERSIAQIKRPQAVLDGVPTASEWAAQVGVVVQRRVREAEELVVEVQSLAIKATDASSSPKVTTNAPATTKVSISTCSIRCVRRVQLLTCLGNDGPIVGAAARHSLGKKMQFQNKRIRFSISEIFFVRFWFNLDSP